MEVAKSSSTQSSSHKKEKSSSKHSSSGTSSSNKSESKKKSSKHRTHREDRSSSRDNSPVLSKRKHSSSEEEANNNESSESEHEKERKSSSSHKHSSSSSRADEKNSSKKHRHEEKDKSSEKRKKEHKKEKESNKNSNDQSPQSSSAATTSSNGDISMSIEETNKLRAKLGLKPLSASENKATTSSESKPDDEKAKKTYIDKDTNQEFEHVPAKNLADLKEQKELRHKLQEQREKRQLVEKLKKIKGIADSDDENEESAQDWLKKQKEKEEALKKAKLLEEMDAQFGVGDLIETTTTTTTTTVSQSIKSSKLKKDETKSTNNKKGQYDADHLKGLRVEHDQSLIKEGQEIILTLKDRAILKGTGDNIDVDDDDDADVLVNVNLVDHENAIKNIENKKKKADYTPYDEFDEEGLFKEKAILNKYDEQLEGEKKKSFRLGAKGTYDTSDEKFLEKLEQEHKSRAVKLETLNELRMANDYYTPQELEKFKKPKKVRKVLRKNKMIKADDLIPLDKNVETTSSSLGSKSSSRKEKPATASKTNENLSHKTSVKEEPAEAGEITSNDVEDSTKSNRTSNNKKHISLKDIDFELDSKSKSDSSDDENDSDNDEDNETDSEKLDSKQIEELKQIIEEEKNVLDELHTILSKTRKRVTSSMLNANTIDMVAQAAAVVKEENNHEESGIAYDKLDMVVEENEDDKDYLKNSLTLDTMSEFCRNLGSLPSKSFGDEDYEDEDEFAQTKKEKSQNGTTSDNEMKEDSDSADESEDEETKSKNKSIDEERTEGFGILDEEPIVDRGLATALKLAVNKGYVEKEKNKQNARLTKASIEAVHYTVEEKHYYDIDDKYNRNRDRYSGPLLDFSEKSNYKPDVKLDYIDEKGHAMNEKEAFRYLSHRFHGKGSGKKKTEKIIKKTKEMELKNKMSSVDTPLNTVALLVEKQKKLQQPFVVLSAPKGKHDQVTLHKR